MTSSLAASATASGALPGASHVSCNFSHSAIPSNAVPNATDLWCAIPGNTTTRAFKACCNEADANPFLVQGTCVQACYIGSYYGNQMNASASFPQCIYSQMASENTTMSGQIVGCGDAKTNSGVRSAGTAGFVGGLMLAMLLSVSLL